MGTRKWFGFCLAIATVAIAPRISRCGACCAVAPEGVPVVNADQTVIMIWDPDTKTQHFIRRASFKSQARDFGFLIPSPSQPELSQSDNAAFDYLEQLAGARPAPSKGFAGGGAIGGGGRPAVQVLEEKTVAGFDAVVLEASSAEALTEWLKKRGYVFSPAVQAWARPYIKAGWKFTALKVARKADDPKTPGKKSKKKKELSPDVEASALRMSFKTDFPLFPYREPESRTAADRLGAKQRSLRIYFLSDARYEGRLGLTAPWTGKSTAAKKIAAADRTKLLELLKLPETTGPKEWWLTVFEDNWAYRSAPADLVFLRSRQQSPLRR